MDRRHIGITAITLAGALAAGPTLGQDWTRDWYFGANGGQSMPDESGLDDANGWKAYVGYKFNPYLGLQAGYNMLGDFDIKGTNASIEVDGWDVTAVGSYPLAGNSDVVLFGKVGAYTWEADASLAVGDDDGTDMTYGVGALYRFPNDVAARLEWDRYQDVGDDDIDMVSAGVSLGY